MSDFTSERIPASEYALLVRRMFNTSHSATPSSLDFISAERSSKLKRELYKVHDKVFLVVNEKTMEVRTDERLGKLLREKYETVMESRYFGRGGIEIVKAGGQLGESEIEDLVRLSYNLTKEREGGQE